MICKLSINRTVFKSSGQNWTQNAWLSQGQEEGISFLKIRGKHEEGMAGSDK